MNTVMPTLIRRELWEHRALWMAPLVVSSLILLGAIAIVAVGDVNLDVATAMPLTDEQQHRLFARGVWALTIPHYLTMLVILFFYALDSLYAERKDRSILFWKSMPVSDAATVTSKLLVALVVLPFGVYAVALVTDLVISGIWGAWLMNVAPDFSPWNTLVWLNVHGLMLLAVVLSVLWYAPVVAYLLLVSAWAKRNVFLWAMLPPIIAIAVEAVLLRSSYIATFLGYRLGAMWSQLGGSSDVAASLFGGHASLGSGPDMFENVASAFANVDLWLGLAAAGALVFAAIRIRQYRDDT